MEAEIFISHSTQNKEIAERVCQVFERNGLRCWIAPRDVPVGASWPASITQAIEETKAFVLVLSPSANSSRHVTTEVNLAFSNRKTILVLRTEDFIPADDLRYFLTSTQWLDGFPPPIDAHLNQMATAMRLLLQKDQLKSAPEAAPAAPPPPARGTILMANSPPPAATASPAAQGAAPGRARSTVRRPASTQPPAAFVQPKPASMPPLAERTPTPLDFRVFDTDGAIRLSAFAFAIDGVLLRAARRRNEQHRARASITDFITGLLRAGGLTRLLMQRVGLDPDALYNQLLDTLETAPPTEPSPPSVSKVLNDGNVPDASQLQAMLARWILHKRDDFTPPLAELLERTSNTPNSPVTEQAVIEAIIDSPEWTATVIGLPAPADIRAALSVLGHSQAVDKNGAVPIGFLSPRAREIVERAHRLSQQCRCAGITHRLFLAAFVERIDGFAAKVCQQAGVDTSLLQSLLVTISGESKEAGDDAPPNVILSPEVCARIVSPVLAQARREAHDPENVSECELFRAFCRIADPRFQQFLRVRATTEELELTEADLSELMSIEPDKPDRLDRLTLRAREVVRTAHRLARERGIRSIPNRLMLAALLAEDESCACRLLEKRGLPARKLYDLLVASVEGGTASASDLDDETCARIVTPTIARARRLAASDGFVTERILFRAFCEDADPAFKTALAERGIDLDAIATGRTMLSEPGAWGPN